jgi:amino acid adenylation domain-containing protein
MPEAPELQATGAGLPAAGWLDGPAVETSGDIWSQLETACRSYPGRLAVHDTAAGRSLSYAALHDRVATIAEALAELGAGPGDIVAVGIPRSADEVAAVAAILRLGAAFCGFDTHAPDARLREQLIAARPVVVAGTGAEGRKLAQLSGCLLLDLDRLGPHAPTNRRSAPARPVADSMCYLSFTSGSTNTPKGVRVPHRGVLRLIRGADYIDLGPGDRFLRLAPLAFDASLLELFLPLVRGATLEIFPPGPVALPALAEFLVQRDITVCWLTAGLLRELVSHHASAFAGLRQVISGGDVVPADTVRTLLRQCSGLRFTNGYGPTECTTFATTWTVTDPATLADRVPIGLPIAGTSAWVAADGELFLAGDGLALDYLDAPELTRQAFGQLAGRRAYRTGDVVEYTADGALCFLGRADGQVKIRGYRVETAEVEGCLRRHPNVLEASVVALPTAAGHRELAAAVVLTDPTHPAGPTETDLIASVRRQVRNALPDYCVPTRWLALTSLPLTENGKVDASALIERFGAPVDDPPALAATEDADQIRGLVRDVWSGVLGSDDFDDDEGFFEVGGDSLQLVEVHRLLCTVFPNRRLRIVDLFKHPTVNHLTANVLTEAADV